jgi:homoserine kinase type II
MSVFTTIKTEQLARYLIMFELGDLVSFEPIEQGIENSNFFVTVEQQGVQKDFVLTLFEELTFDDLPFFNQLSNHLYHYGLPVATARQTLDGMTSTIFCGKPTLLFPRLPGNIVSDVTPSHCAAIGQALAEIHETVQSCGLTRVSEQDLAWLRSCQEKLAGYFDPEERELLAGVIQTYEKLWSDGEGLPRGIIHGDLFRDNVLFQGEELTGIIDFYHASEDYFVLDLAIAVNDWCSRPDGSLAVELQRAVLVAYQSQRKISDREMSVWPEMLQVAAAEFWVSRALVDAEGDRRKDPEEFKRILCQHSERPNSFPEGV